MEFKNTICKHRCKHIGGGRNTEMVWVRMSEGRMAEVMYGSDVEGNIH